MKPVEMKPSFYNSEVWYDHDFGFEQKVRNGHYRVNFKGIAPEWLLRLAKKFMYQHVIRRKFSGVIAHIYVIRTFGEFVSSYYSTDKSLLIDRDVIVKFIHYLSRKSSIKNQTRNGYLISLRNFFEFCQQNSLLRFSRRPIFFDEDFSKPSVPVPKFIPGFVLRQLNQHLDHLIPYLKHMVIIMRETGRRISEVSTLSPDCLMSNSQGEHTLKFYDHKLKKEGLIPINQICADTIISQRQWAAKKFPQNKEYLFPGREGIFCVSPRTFNTSLNILAERFKIVDENGKIWHFHSHQFRHTVGTQMINSGIPQHIVQRYLGHKNSKMTNYYAHILDDTLKREFEKFQKNLVDVTGKIYDEEYDKNDIIEVQWLRKNILGQALPNGYCALPVWQKRCPHANACLTCANFRTSTYFLPQHENHLETTEKILSIAESKGWDHQIEINKTLKRNLEVVVNTLKRNTL